MQGNQRLVNFIQGTLGCTCPPTIFEHIEDTKAVCDTWHFRQFIVGHRLLIFMQAINDINLLKKALPILTARGKAVRNQKKLNRFRLVIVSLIPEQLTPLAKQIFGQQCPDEKMHLHVISQAEIIDL